MSVRKTTDTVSTIVFRGEDESDLPELLRSAARHIDEMDSILWDVTVEVENAVVVLYYDVIPKTRYFDRSATNSSQQPSLSQDS